MNSSLSAPLESCEVTRRRLLAILAGLPADKWHARPGMGSWTVAHHVDHLIRSEVGTSKMARRLIRGDFRELTKPPDAPLYDSRLDRYPYGQLAAPDGLVPEGIEPNQAVVQLAAVHLRFLEELERFEGPDADALAAPDPATGVWFTLAGWVRLQELHEAHHILQILSPEPLTAQR
jgi:hypothetical protein